MPRIIIPLGCAAIILVVGFLSGELGYRRGVLAGRFHTYDTAECFLYGNITANLRHMDGGKQLYDHAAKMCGVP
jgi:hypothetical protein